MKNPFTVISYNEETGQIYSDHVEAESMSQAFSVAAEERADESVDVVFIAALAGHQTEGDGQIDFAGESGVYGFTILEQPEVFDAA